MVIRPFIQSTRKRLSKLPCFPSTHRSGFDMMVWGTPSGWLAITVASYCPSRSSPRNAQRKNKQNIGPWADGNRVI